MLCFHSPAWFYALSPFLMAAPPAPCPALSSLVWPCDQLPVSSNNFLCFAWGLSLAIRVYFVPITAGQKYQGINTASQQPSNKDGQELVPKNPSSLTSLLRHPGAQSFFLGLSSAYPWWKLAWRTSHWLPSHPSHFPFPKLAFPKISS